MNFFIQLGVDADTVKIKDFVRSLNELPLAAVEGILALAGVSMGMKEMIEGSLGSALGFRNFEAQTGLSSKKLQEWQNVAEQVSVSNDAMAASLANLNKNITQIQLGGGNAAPFALLGIDPRTNPYQIIEQLRRKIHEYTGDRRRFFLQQLDELGVLREIVPFLEMSNAELARRSKLIEGMDFSKMKEFLALQEGLKETGLIFKQLAYDFTELFGPIFKFGIDRLKVFIENLDTLLGYVKAIKEDIQGWQEGKISAIGELLKKAKDLFTAAGGPILSNVIPSTISPGSAAIPLPYMHPGGGAYTINQDVKIDVHSTDPVQAGQQTADHLKKMINDADQHLNKVVR